MIDEEKIFTRPEMADKLTVCISTLDALVKNKKINFTQIGKRIIFTEDDFREFMARQKKWTIRDSVKEFLKLIPSGAEKRDFNNDTSGFAGVVAWVKKTLRDMQWELEAEAWHDSEIVKKTRILVANLEAIVTVCETDIPDLDVAFVQKLAGREIQLWETEIKPNLKLNPKYLDIGKLKNIELLAVLGHQMEKTGSGFRESMPLKIRVAGEHYLISDKTWTPIPPPDSNDELSFFAQREMFKIRIALKTSKPISEREKAAAAEKAKIESDENKSQLEIELLTGE